MHVPFTQRTGRPPHPQKGQTRLPISNWHRQRNDSKTEAIRSEAPFITLGCSIKSSVEFTNPVNFIHDLILVKSLLHAFLACDTMLKAHL